MMYISKGALHITKENLRNNLTNQNRFYKKADIRGNICCRAQNFFREMPYATQKNVLKGIVQTKINHFFTTAISNLQHIIFLSAIFKWQLRQSTNCLLPYTKKHNDIRIAEEDSFHFHFQLAGRNTLTSQINKILLKPLHFFNKMNKKASNGCTTNTNRNK